MYLATVYKAYFRGVTVLIFMALVIVNFIFPWEAINVFREFSRVS